MWGRLVMAGPPVNLTQPRHPQLLGVVECSQQTETYPPGLPDTPYLGPGVTPHHVRVPWDVIIGRRIMALSSSWSERVTQTGPGEVESDRSLNQAPGQPAGWAGLGGGRGVSGFSPGWMAIFGVGCSTYSHSSQCKEALGSAGAGAVGGISHPSTERLWVSDSSPGLASCSSQGGPIRRNRGLPSTS